MRLTTRFALVAIVGMGCQNQSPAVDTIEPLKPVAECSVTEMATMRVPLGVPTVSPNVVDLDENGRALILVGPTSFEPGSSAFIWEDGRRTELAIPEGFESIVVSDMSNRGEVAGYATRGPAENLVARAFVWRDGAPQPIPTGENNARAVSINELGHVAGIIGDASPPRGFLWTGGDAVIDLGEGYVADMNDRDDVLLNASRSYVWRDGARIAFGTGGAARINERGQVTGEIARDPDVFSRAFLWDEESGLRELGRLSGVNTAPRALNNRGDVVGYAEVDEGGPGEDLPTAVIWPGGGDPIALAPFDFYADEATDVNERGQVVGIAIDQVYLWSDGSAKLLPQPRADRTLFTYAFPSVQINDRGDIVASGELTIYDGEGAYSFSGETVAVMWRCANGVPTPPPPTPLPPDDEPTE